MPAPPSLSPSRATPGVPPHPERLVQPWNRFRQAFFEFESSKLDFWMALRNAIGVALPLALGVWLHQVNPGIIVALGALNVAFADGPEPYRQRIGLMLASCGLVSLALFIGAVTAATLPGAVAAAALWAFAAGMLVSLGLRAGNIGVSSTCVILVFSVRPMPVSQAFAAALLALSGGLLQVGLTALFWPLQRYGVERQSLAAFYLELAQLPHLGLDRSLPPAATKKATAASEAIAALAGNHSIQSERYRALLDQGERIRISLLTLRGLRQHAMERPKAAALVPMLDEFLAAAAAALQAIGHALASSQSPSRQPSPAAGAEALLAAFRAWSPEAAAPTIAADVDVQMDALTRQLRVTSDLADHATPAGSLVFEEARSAQPWNLRVGSTWATLGANLTLRSTVFRHAIRLAACLAVGDFLGRLLASGTGWTRSYWLPLTIAVVLKPDFSATFSRGAQRLAGTLTGLLIATLLFHLLPPWLPVRIGLVVLATFFVRWAGRANYGLLALGVASLVVLLIAIGGVAPGEVILARGYNTALGGVLALLAYWLWPTWERAQLRAIFAQLLTAYWAHLELLGRACSGEAIPAGSLNKTRQESRLARSNLEASVDRLAGEPGTTRAQLNQWHALLASSHLFVHASIMIEAHLLAAPRVETDLARTPAFQVFLRQVGLAIQALIRALAPPAGAVSAFPDLREAHRALLAAGTRASTRHSLVSVESDRLVNSLNTMREQLLPLLPSSSRRPEDQPAPFPQASSHPA